MKLYLTKRSPYARKVRILALEKGIKLELIEENLTEKSKGLLFANPLGKVPTLVTDEGVFLCDSPVICEYLEAQKPSPRLVAPAGKHRFQALHMAAIADGVMDTSVSLFMEKLRHPNDINEAYMAHLENAILGSYDYFEANIDVILEFNLASIAVACAIGYINFRLPHLDPKLTHTKLNEWYDKISERPSLQETIPIA